MHNPQRGAAALPLTVLLVFALLLVIASTKRQIVTEVRASGAAALCVGVGPGRFVEALGPPATDIANADGFPLIEIPWELRFSDITRAIVERLLAQRHAQRDADADRARFTITNRSRCGSSASTTPAGRSCL